LLVFFVYLLSFVLQSFTFADCVLLQSVSLLGEDVTHLCGGYLKVVPSFEHVVGVERSTSDRSDVAVLLLNPSYLIHNLLFFDLDSVEFTHDFTHLLHIFGFCFKLAHDTLDVLLDLLAFKFD